MSNLSLDHIETDVAPECRVVFGGGRWNSERQTSDMRRIELSFQSAYYARAAPVSDMEDIESVGYAVKRGFSGNTDDYHDWLHAEWTRSGICPEPNFYVAIESDWARNTPSWTGAAHQHYVLVGRDGFVEVLAEGYAWREWIWTAGDREENTAEADVVASGRGAD